MYPRWDETSGLYGYWGRTGWAFPPQFKYAHNFRCGYAAVDLIDDRQALLARDGAILSLEKICSGRSPIANEDITFTGFAADSCYAEICTENHGRREWGLIDQNLKYIPLPKEVFGGASEVKPFGRYLVVSRASGRLHESMDGLFNIADMQLELPIKYACIYPSLESLWVVSREIDEKQGTNCFAFYDVHKRSMLRGWFWEALPFSCGFGAIRSNEGGPFQFVNEDLKPVFDTSFDSVGPFSFGLAAVYKGSDAGYVDTQGEMRLLLPYNELKPFNRFGLAIANRGDETWVIDIIDRQGKPRVTGLETAVFWDSDFPHFEVSKGVKSYCIDMDLTELC